MKTLNMTMNVLTLAVGLTFAAFNVNAATQDAGTLTELPVITSFIQSPGAIADVLTFTLDTPSETFGDSKLWFSAGNKYTVDPGLTLELFKVGSASSLGIFGFESEFSVALGGGDYYFNITGVTTGTKGGAYSVALYAEPVPEPETYAMMLAGLGLMGFVARRRKIG